MVIIRKICELTWLFLLGNEGKVEFGYQTAKKQNEQRGGKARGVCLEKHTVQHAESVAGSSEERGGEGGGKGVPRRVSSVREELGQDRESTGEKGFKTKPLRNLRIQRLYRGKAADKGGQEGMVREAGESQEGMAPQILREEII